MKMKKLTFLIAAAIFLMACLLLYNSLDASNSRRKEQYDVGRKQIDELEVKLRQLELDLDKNQQLINQIRNNIYQLVGGGKGDVSAIPKILYQTKQPIESPAAAARVETFDVDNSTCSFMLSSRPRPDVQMLDVYEVLKFDNPNGGVWKQGWDVKYVEKDVEEKEAQLRVIVIPHSHDDPGWLKTFERYYEEQVKNILDNMIVKLTSEPRMKFIYAEMSFFERWWREIDDIKRSAVRQVVKRGQFEIVTGAWVMTDEANSHYFSMIDQMIEGHQWLHNNLDFQPRHHWSIDPFGLSPTMAYLTKAANFTTMTIQRIHYSVKKLLAQNKQLEFMWRQIWDPSKTTDIFTHMMPFYSYDAPHSCGPDPKICCQFDFKRLPGSMVTCPWNIPPEPITEANVAERAATLLDQYRKKAQLYKTNVILVPLGDDFRYDSKKEWDDQFDNYQRLFDYMNSNTRWNVKAEFGTMADYFATLFQRLKIPEGSHPPEFPVLSGDFFTYADRDDHYWSGYYTSRPLHKRMDRIVQHYLRGAEIIYSLSLAMLNRIASSSDPVQRNGVAGYPFNELFALLVEARRLHGIFQHHDGITGTAKDHVVLDYGQKLAQAIKNCMTVIATSSHFLLTAETGSFRSDIDNPHFQSAESRVSSDVLPDKDTIRVSSTPRVLAIYNSLPYAREELVCIVTDSVDVEILDTAGKPVIVQINPLLYKQNRNLIISTSAFEVCFIAKLPPIGVSKYSLKSSAANHNELSSFEANFDSKTSGFVQKPFPEGEQFTVDGHDLSAKFSTKGGTLKVVTDKQSAKSHAVSVEFVKYGTVNAYDKSGAYLFLPDGPAQPVNVASARVAIIRGPLFTAVISEFPQLMHTVRVLKQPVLHAQSISIQNLVDVTQEFNYELAMRFVTEVENSDGVFFTDLNGFQMIKRKRFDKIPLQGNVYPMPAAAYIEDQKVKFTLLSGQPLGVGAHRAGSLEVMLDRRLNQDDNRGLAQGVADNRLTPSFFSVLVEAKQSVPTTDSSSKVGALSGLAHFTSLMLMHPPFVSFQKEPQKSLELMREFAPLKSLFPCDFHLLNLRTLQTAGEYSQLSTTPKPRNEHALLLHRIPLDCSVLSKPKVQCQSSGGKLEIDSLFSHLVVDSIERRSLTLVNKLADDSLSKRTISVDTMNVFAYVVKLK